MASLLHQQHLMQPQEQAFGDLAPTVISPEPSPLLRSSECRTTSSSFSSRPQHLDTNAPADSMHLHAPSAVPRRSDSNRSLSHMDSMVSLRSRSGIPPSRQHSHLSTDGGAALRRHSSSSRRSSGSHAPLRRGLRFTGFQAYPRGVNAHDDEDDNDADGEAVAMVADMGDDEAQHRILITYSPPRFNEVYSDDDGQPEDDDFADGVALVTSLSVFDEVEATTRATDFCMERTLDPSGNTVVFHDDDACSVCLDGQCHSPAALAVTRRPSFDARQEDDEMTTRAAENQGTLSRPADVAAVCRLPCGHVFHVGCVVRWLALNWSCPNCRALLRHLAYTD